MIRFAANLVGGLFLALAIVFAVSDAARSIASDALHLVPLGDALQSMGLSTSALSARADAVSEVWQVVAGWPAAAVLVAIAFLFLLAGRPRRRRLSLYR